MSHCTTGTCGLGSGSKSEPAECNRPIAHIPPVINVMIDRPVTMPHPSFSSLPSQHTLPTTPIPAHLSKITKTGSLPVLLPEGVPPKKSIMIQYQFGRDSNVPMLKEAARPSVQLDRYVADSCVLKD